MYFTNILLLTVDFHSPVHAMSCSDQVFVVDDGGSTDVGSSQPSCGSNGGLPRPVVRVGFISPHNTKATSNSTSWRKEVDLYLIMRYSNVKQYNNATLL